MFVYTVVSVNRYIVRYNKYLVVVTVVVVLSIIVIVIVISLEHSTVVVGVFIIGRGFCSTVVYTGRMYGCQKCTRIYTARIHGRSVHTTRIYGPYKKALFAMLFGCTARIYG